MLVENIHTFIFLHELNVGFTAFCIKDVEFYARIQYNVF
jgi:hypothetical protein